MLNGAIEEKNRWQKFSKPIGIAVLLLVVLTGIASATNLVSNGGFEQPVLGDSWHAFFTIPGWTELYGKEMEIQTSKMWTPYEGNQYLELDAYESTTVYQDIPTTPGAEYTLSFAFSPRPGIADNQLQVSWDGNVLGTMSANGASISNTDWTVHSYTVTATKPTTRLQFHNLDVSDTWGTFLDDVVLTPTTSSSIPEFPSVAIPVAAILGLVVVFGRRKNMV